MNYVMTLIDDPQRAQLQSGHVETVLSALASVGAQPGAPDWLADGVACDLPFRVGPSPPGPVTPGSSTPSAGEPTALEEMLRRALEDAPLDLAIQQSALRRKRLLVADMESTIIQQEMLDELGDLVGRRAEIAEVTERSMRGELDFEEALRERVALLSGLTQSDISSISERMTLMGGAETLVATLRHHGGYCALVSGGFTCFAEPIAERLGFDLVRANRLKLEDGRLTGEVVPPILGRETKLEVLQELCEKLEITPAEAAAVGDGANDLAMLQEAGLGVAFRGKPLVRQAARFRLDHADLTGLLFLQGYRAEEFVTA